MPDLAIPGFRLGQVLGRGGFATVYLAEQPALGRRVAIKVLDTPLTTNDQRQRFQREARAAGSLSSHPNIVATYDSGITPTGHAYLVMEHMPRGTLADHVQQHGPLPWGTALAHIIKIAGALETAHQAGVLHRDVKPENILLDATGNPRLTDFGIASMVGEFQTMSAKVSLSLAHAAPEVISGTRATTQSDTYSLASTLYTLLAGHPAFTRNPDEDTLIPLIARIATNPPPDITNQTIPPDIHHHLQQALSKNPNQRPTTTLDFANQLRTTAHDHGVSLPQPATIHINNNVPAAENRTRRTSHKGRADTTRRHGSLERRTSTTSVKVGIERNRSDRSRRTRWAFLLLAAGLTLTGVGVALRAQSSPSPPAPLASAPSTVPGASTTVAMGTPEMTGQLQGMKGPHGPLAAVPNLTQSFMDGILSVPSGHDLRNRKKTDFVSAGESYDAVIILALAMESAKSDGISHAAKVIEVSKGGEQCFSFVECRDKLDAGRDIDYEGISGSDDLNGMGDLRAPGYVTVQFGPNNRIGDGALRIAQVPDLQSISINGTRPGDGQFTVAALGPLTGELANSAPQMFAGVELAVNDINFAGGVLGKPVILISADVGDSPADASLAVSTLVSQKVDAIVGPLASSFSALESMVTSITRAGITLFNPAQVYGDLSTTPDNGLYFSNFANARAEASLIARMVQEDGNHEVAIISEDDAILQSFANAVKIAIEDAALITGDIYLFSRKSFDETIVTNVRDRAADAIIVITNSDDPRVLKQMILEGIGPRKQNVYGWEGNMVKELGENLDIQE